MALALNNLKRVDMPLNKETKPNLSLLFICVKEACCKTLVPMHTHTHIYIFIYLYVLYAYAAKYVTAVSPAMFSSDNNSSIRYVFDAKVFYHLPNTPTQY